jgi:hypothetical protein
MLINACAFDACFVLIALVALEQINEDEDRSRSGERVPSSQDNDIRTGKTKHTGIHSFDTHQRVRILRPASRDMRVDARSGNTNHAVRQRSSKASTT